MPDGKRRVDASHTYDGKDRGERHRSTLTVPARCKDALDELKRLTGRSGASLLGDALIRALIRALADRGHFTRAHALIDEMAQEGKRRPVKRLVHEGSPGHACLEIQATGTDEHGLAHTCDRSPPAESHVPSGEEHQIDDRGDGKQAT